MLNKEFWPSQEAFLPIDHLEQITDGHVRCSAVAICDDQGNPCKKFYQGQEAHFFYEFEISDVDDIPIGGLAINDTLGYCIHSKDSLLYGVSPIDVDTNDYKIRFHQSIKLELAKNTYFFDVNFESLRADFYNEYCSGSMRFDDVNRRIHRHCRINQVSSFSIELTSDGKSLTNGLTNLPGTCEILPIIQGQIASKPEIAENKNISNPTILHITHWKAGSQWIKKILQECVPDYIIEPQPNQFQFFQCAIQPGKVYPTLYITKQGFDSVRLPSNTQKFIIIRDLRDTLVSGYFSIKNSHPKIIPRWEFLRLELMNKDLEEGFIFLMDEWLIESAKVQLSWLEAHEPIIRYEDIIENDIDILKYVLLEVCHLPTTAEKLQEVILANRFNMLTEGRQRGQEDKYHHFRKGISGDWRNYFTDRITEAFKARFGGLLIASGYENGWNWESESQSTNCFSFVNNYISSKEYGSSNPVGVLLSHSSEKLDGKHKDKNGKTGISDMVIEKSSRGQIQEQFNQLETEFVTQDDFETACQNIRNPKTTALPYSDSRWIVYHLKQLEFEVEDFIIDVDDYHQYFKKARYTEDFPEYYSFNIREKSLEHYIAAKMLDLKSDDIYIDVASQHSPIPKIYSGLFGVTSYRQDLDYPPGLNGDTIGGDAANMPIPDRFTDKMALHCSFEHFEGDADWRFIHEIERVLKPGGKVCIVPLYLSSQYHIITDPLIAISQNVDFEKDTLVFCKRGWNNRFGRVYDPVSLLSRIKQNLGSLKMKIFNIKNAKEVDSSCYVEYAMLLEKEGEIVSTLLVEDYIKLADDKVAVGDIDGAIDTLFECSGLYPDVAEVYQLLAVLMIKKQTYQSAKAMLDKAIALKPDNADLYNQLGAVQYLAGDMDASRAAYEKALTIDPNLEHVKANLEELSQTSAAHEVSSAVENELTDLLDQINRHIAFSRALTDNLVSMAERVEKILSHPVTPAITPSQETQSDYSIIHGKGFYQDEGGFRWVASEGQLMLSSVSQFEAMEMDFDLSCANANCYQKFPFETWVFANDEEKAHLVFDVDEQTRSVKLNIPTNIQDVVVKIVSSQSFVPARLGGGSPDTRELSVQFRNLNLSTVPREVQVNEPDDAKTKAEREAQARNQEEVNWWKHFIFKHFSPDRETSEKLFLERFRIECTKRWDYICEPLSIDTYQYREAALLDIGNGPCGILNFIPGHIKVGIDPNNKMYRENEILYNVEKDVRYITCPAEKLPLAGEYFDFISCVNVLDHVSDPQIVLNEIIRVLKPGGVFFLSVDTRKEEETSLVHPHAFDGDKFIEMAVPLVCLHARNDQPCYDDNPVNKRFDGWFRKP